VAPPGRTSSARRTLGLIALVAALAGVVVASLALGERDIAPATVLRALVGAAHPGEAYEAIVVVDERLPRTFLGLVVGAALGASGVIMQAVTRNPLVDGGILGTELGAAVAVVVAVLVFEVSGVGTYFWFALAGAALTTAAVYWLSRLITASSPAVGLVLTGAAASALLGALISVLTIRDTAVYAHYRYWSVGQLVGRSDTIDSLWPFIVLGIAAALCLGGLLNVLVLGDAVASALGVRTQRARLGAMAVAVLLCAAATAATGPIAFVGLVGAHLARLLVGADHRWVIPFSLLSGALLVLAADVLGRLTPGGGEVQVGIMTAVVGTPFFIALARRRRVVQA
jgi:iron complex transport system permease protein